MNSDFKSDNTKLTSFSRGAGCGCKISPKVLDKILSGVSPGTESPTLLVGNQSRDDAAVMDLGDGTAIISTTDFFTPVVDDPYDFGRIAAANAISDVFAMGGKPLMAIAILGWPVDKIPLEVASAVLEGGRFVCAQAGIPLAGGHSIDAAEPFFGLCVTGRVNKEHLKRNNTPNPGDLIFLTKPLGTGILSTAMKRGVLVPEDQEALTACMSSLNSVGEQLGTLATVSAMTDVTGFGLLGHLLEMIGGNDCSALVSYGRIKMLPGTREYIRQRISPDATTRNWGSYGEKVQFKEGLDIMEAFLLLPDPQTNGGLLFTIAPEEKNRIQQLLETVGLGNHAEPIGYIAAKQEKDIIILT